MSPTCDNQSNLRLEYDLLHRARMNWTDAMMRWRQISLPLSAAIVSFFVVLSTELWGVGWFLGVCLLVYWRCCEREVDRQIVRFYPRILELEKALKLEFYSLYIFNNRNMKLDDVATLQERVPNGEYNYQGLLDMAAQHGARFVGARGHNIHNWLVKFYIAIGSLSAAIYYPLLLTCNRI